MPALTKPDTCRGCPLHELPFGKRWGYVPADGNGTNGVLVVLEAAGKDEEATGRPTVGKAGHYLWSQLKRIDLERDDFRIHNVLSCRPPENKLRDMPYTEAAIAHCAPNLDATIADMRERCRRNGKHFTILALGDFAMRRVLGIDQKAPFANYLSYVHWSEAYQAHVVASYHPSHLMQGKNHLLPILHYAARKAVEIASEGVHPYQGHYLCDPAPTTFAQWIRDYRSAAESDPEGTYLAFDIETPHKQGMDEEELTKEEGDDYHILRCSFAYRPGEAVSVPWTAEYTPYLEDLFATPWRKLAHNSNYDYPRIIQHFPIKGTVVDTMVAWHVVNSTLPKGLGFITPFYVQNAPMWKHTSRAEPAKYNAIDSDMTVQCWQGIRKNLIENRQWEVFEDHVIRLNQALYYMSGRGVLLDQQKRQEAEIRLTDLLDVTELKIQATVPVEARRLHPTHGYAKTPKSTDGLVRANFVVRRLQCDRCQLAGVTRSHVKAKKKGNPCEGAVLTEVQDTVERWAKPLEFKDSKVQLANYQKTMKHQAVLARKERKVTFDEGAILKLMKQYPLDPLYPLLLEHREYQKLLSTYIGMTGDGGVRGGMPVGKDNRIRTIFTHNPSTLRLASQNPNMQNLPRPGGPNDLASLVRNMIVAAPGMILVARDFCVDPDAKILKADLTWTSARDVRAGDELIGFDEAVGIGHTHSYRSSTVKRVSGLIEPKVKVTTTRGETIVSADHPLVARYKSYGRRWVKAKNLKPGMLMPFLEKPWDTDMSRDGGYLAGFLDGEGYIGRGSVGFGQNDGPVLAQVLEMLHHKGFTIVQHGRGQRFKDHVQFKYACISGLHHQLKLLGTTRPTRLLNKSRQIWEGKRTYGKTSQYAVVLSVEPIGDGAVVALETTTKTFISDGFFSHNCGIEAVLVGYEARSPRYIRLAKMDVHSYYTAYALHELDKRISANDLPSLEWEDARLAPHLAGIKREFKKERNNLYKHLIHACLTGDHEVLTPQGWKSLACVTPQEQVAQWAPSGAITFVTPTHHTNYWHTDPLIRVQGCGLAALMTPQHRIPTISPYGTLTERRAGTLLEEAVERRIPICGTLIGEDSSWHGHPAWIQLAVAIQADGCVRGNHVVFHLVKDRKRLRLRTLLHAVNVPYHVVACRCHQDGERISFNVKHSPIWSLMSQAKDFSLETLLGLPVALREVFLDELPYWDGTRPPQHANHQTCYITTRQANADCVQTIAHVTNRQALLRRDVQSGKKIIYRVSFNRRKQARIGQKHVSAVIEPQQVYCLTVPTGWFLVRYRDRISVTGNSNFGQTAKGAQEKIFTETRVEHPVGRVKRLMEIYRELFPEIGRWQTEIQFQADRDGFVRNAFGYIHRFYRVFAWSKEYGKWVRKPGDDADKVLAFKPQSNAAGIIKEAMLTLFFERFEEAGQYLRLTVHDELLCECPEAYATVLDGILEEVMGRPIQQLSLPASYGMGSHLSIGTEGKAGHTWGSMA